VFTFARAIPDQPATVGLEAYVDALGLALTAPLRRARVTLAVLAVTFAWGALLAGAAWAAPDLDRDGHADGDCAPLDPAVHPSAVDKPDLTFEDTNCDGIDGDVRNAIFVSLDGDDAAAGTKTNPMRTVARGVVTAAEAGADVYVAAGSYETEPAGGVPLADGVSLYGGYKSLTWTRSADQVTTIKGSPQALLAQGDSRVVLQLLSLEGTPDASLSAYGLRAVSDASGPSRLALSNVSVTGAPAAPGANGQEGGDGAVGHGRSGGWGGLGGCGSGVTGQPGALGSGSGPGADGSDGANAVAPGAPDAASWMLAFGRSGGAGGLGAGGQGGTGGTGSTNIFFPVCGGRGGYGGAGGGGGSGGGGGQNGGGSFGIYIFSSSVVASNSTIGAGDGGAGGDGADGGNGGAGASGELGWSGDCSGSNCAGRGQTGSSGVAGGHGGGGGGGAGGPSFAVYQAGNASNFSAGGRTVLTSGSGGPGGSSFSRAGTPTSAPDGEAAELRRSPSAPERSTADFDRDGVADPADSCPYTPGVRTDCPVRPPKVSPPAPGQSKPAAGGAPGSSPGVAPARDTTPPSWSISAAKKQRALKRKSVTFGVRPNESCAFTVIVKLGKRTLGKASKALPGGATSTIQVRLGKKALRALRKSFARQRKVAVVLTLTGVDAGGNAKSATKRLQLSR
jgi:hypothetical protein